ncbi:MAG: hypothetical protein J6C89_06455 [Clostridia bacterium]|nr:hypothetical protein [Clostridia bacterium]
MRKYKPSYTLGFSVTILKFLLWTFSVIIPLILLKNMDRKSITMFIVVPLLFFSFPFIILQIINIIEKILAKPNASIEGNDIYIGKMSINARSVTSIEISIDNMPVRRRATPTYVKIMCGGMEFVLNYPSLAFILKLRLMCRKAKFYMENALPSFVLMPLLLFAFGLFFAFNT